MLYIITDAARCFIEASTIDQLLDLPIGDCVNQQVIALQTAKEVNDDLTLGALG